MFDWFIEVGRILYALCASEANSKWRYINWSINITSRMSAFVRVQIKPTSNVLLTYIHVIGLICHVVSLLFVLIKSGAEKATYNTQNRKEKRH